MCTLYDPELSAKVLRELKNGQNQFWKVYRVSGACLCTLYYGHFHVGRGGIVRSDRVSPHLRQFERETGGIDHGIHCSMTYTVAMDWYKIAKEQRNGLPFIVPVYGSARAFVAAGRDGIVFHNIRVRKSDLRATIYKEHDAEALNQAKKDDIERMLREAYDLGS